MKNSLGRKINEIIKIDNENNFYLVIGNYSIIFGGIE